MSAGRALKQKHEVDAEEAQKQQQLEEEEQFAASHVLEPEPPRPVHGWILFRWGTHS
jgi:hypothetical protein